MNRKVVTRTALGCTLIVALMGAFAAVVIVVMSYVVRANQPYKDIIARAQKDLRVVEALGAPVEPGWRISGRIKTYLNRSDADLTIPLRGSRQNGSVHVVGTREGNQPWTYHRMLMTPERGAPIDLLRVESSGE